MSKRANIKEVSVEEFMDAIRKLPPNEYRDRWLRWLSEYDEPGYYNRLAGMNRGAKFVYNHIANPEMLLWLVQAAGVENGLVEMAKDDFNRAPNNAQKQCAAIRNHVPWDVIEQSLW